MILVIGHQEVLQIYQLIDSIENIPLNIANLITIKVKYAIIRSCIVFEHFLGHLRSTILYVKTIFISYDNDILLLD